MLNQIEELLRAGIWIGPAVLGSLCFRVVSEGVSLSSPEGAGALMLATAAIVLTILGTRVNHDKHAALGPAVFTAMFFVSWSIR
jgi:hypothetical protein